MKKKVVLPVCTREVYEDSAAFAEFMKIHADTMNMISEWIRDNPEEAYESMMAWTKKYPRRE